MNYEDFFDGEDIAAYKRVKRGTMIIARVAREIAAEMVDGEILRTGKEFVHTSEGMFRLAMAENSDNSTEQVAHMEMGAKTVIMGSRAEMRWFFSIHGLQPGRAVNRFYREIERRIVYA